MKRAAQRSAALLAVWATACAAMGQAVIQPIVIDGDAANGFPGSSIDLSLSDQSMTNSLPQLGADGTATFRGRVFSNLGGTLLVSDSWWFTREGSYQIAAYAGGPPGIHQVPTAQFGRMYAHADDRRSVVDRAGQRFFEWLDQRWVAGFGAAGWASTIDGAPWFLFSTIDRTNVIMPRADQMVFATRLPPAEGAVGPVNGFAAGWQGAYTTVLATGHPVPSAAGQVLVVPETIDNSDTMLGRSLRMNESNQWVARVGVQGTGVTGVNNIAIWRGVLGGAPSMVVRTNDPAPGWPAEQGARIGALSRPSINSHGHIAFIARVSTAAPEAAGLFSLYVDRGNGLELLARTGTSVVPAAAGGPALTVSGPWTYADGASQSGQLLPPVIGEGGSVAFFAALNAGEAALVHTGGHVYEIVRRDTVLPHTGGRVTTRPFNQGSTQDRATGMAFAANGDVLFSVPATGSYDPRMTSTGIPVHALLSWRRERGVRVVCCQGMALDVYPGGHNRIITTGFLGDGNNHDGVPTGAGHGSGAALLVSVTRTPLETTPLFQAVVLADLDTFGCGTADIAGAGAAPVADGHLDNNDFIVMIDRFFSGDLRADYGKVGGVIGFDDRLDNNDFVAFVDLFFAGCP